MQFPKTPPITQTIVRNEVENDAIVIETLAEKYFDRARDIENDFFGSNGKGCCFGLCPFSWCPASVSTVHLVRSIHSNLLLNYAFILFF